MEEREKEDEEAGAEPKEAGAEPKEKLEEVAGADEAPNSDVVPKADCDAGCCDWPKPPKLKPLPVLLPNEPNDMAVESAAVNRRQNALVRVSGPPTSTSPWQRSIDQRWTLW